MPHPNPPFFIYSLFVITNCSQNKFLASPLILLTYIFLNQRKSSGCVGSPRAARNHLKG